MAKAKANIHGFAERATGAEGQGGETENVSANSRLPISDMLAKMLTWKVPHDPQRRTYLELIVQTLILKAAMGDLPSIKVVLDRTEGRVAPAPKAPSRKEHREPPVFQVIYDTPQSKSEASPNPKVAS